MLIRRNRPAGHHRPMKRTELHDEETHEAKDSDAAPAPDRRDEIIRRLNEALSRPLDELLGEHTEEERAA